MDRNATDDPPKIEHFELLRAEIARKVTVKQEKESQSVLQRKKGFLFANSRLSCNFSYKSFAQDQYSVSNLSRNWANCWFQHAASQGRKLK